MFNVGYGFFLSFLPLQLKNVAIKTSVIGYLSGAYFIGVLTASFCVHRIIERIGHVFSFISFAGSLCCFTLLHGIFFELSFWIILRFLSGFFFIGICIVVESWLLMVCDKTVKGKMLSLYMVLYYASFACGQLYLTRIMGAWLPYLFTVFMIVISTIPVGFAPKPKLVFQKKFSFHIFHLLKTVPFALSGSLYSGIVHGSIGLIPIFFQSMGFDRIAIAKLMGALFGGGLMLQIFIGHFSDIFDRKKVLLFVALSSFFYLFSDG